MCLLYEQRTRRDDGDRLREQFLTERWPCRYRPLGEIQFVTLVVLFSFFASASHDAAGVHDLDNDREIDAGKVARSGSTAVAVAED